MGFNHLIDGNAFMVATLLRFVHISDTHYSSPEYDHPPSRVDTRYGTQQLIRAVNKLPFTPDFILHTGDVAYDPRPEIYPEIKTLFAQFKAPLLYLPGNHDHNAALQTMLMERETPMLPLYYERDMNGVRMIFLDSNGDAKPPAGQVSDEQLVWLRERIALDDARPILVFIHHPLIKTHFSEWYDVYMMTVNGDAVHEILRPAAARIRGVFHGHVHQNNLFFRDNILYSSTVSSWVQFFTMPGQDIKTLNDLESDPGFSVVSVTEESTIIQRYRYRVDPA
jgi:Icc protein